MSKKASVQIVFEPEPAPGILGTFSIFTIALGTQLGVGLISYLPMAISQMGTRAWIVCPIIVLITLFYTAPMFFLASTARCSGGMGGLVCAMTKNPILIGLYQCSMFITPVYVALFPVAFASYLGMFVPGVNTALTGAIMLAIFWVINLLGAKWMARAQNIMFPILLFGLAIFCIFAFLEGDFTRLLPANPEFSIGGTDGLIGGGFLLYSMSVGYMGAVSVGRISRNAKRDIPKALILCVLVLIVLYTVMGVASSIVVPVGEVGSTLGTVASGIFPTWLFVAWMIAVPGLLIATSINGFFTSTTETLNVACQNGWLPESWGRTDKRGTKWILMTLIFVMGLIPVVTGWKVSDLAAYMQLMSFMCEVMCYVLMFRMPKLWKKYWEAAKLHVPNPVLYFFLCTAILTKIVLLVLAFNTMTPVYLYFTLGFIAAAIIWILFRLRTGKAKISIGCWSDGVNAADPDAIANSAKD